jgi:Lsr2
MNVIETYDDLDWQQDETKTPATHTIVFELDGDKCKVDLSEANYDKALNIMPLADLLRVSSPVDGNEPKRRTTRRRKSGRALSPEHQRIRDWVDRNRIWHPDEPGRPAYETSTGLYTWPKWLISRYNEAHPGDQISA